MVKFLFIFFLSFFSFSIYDEPNKLVFSNNPENINIDGSLIDIKITGDYRLFFSHCNQTGQKGEFVVKITDQENSLVNVRRVYGGPNISELYVGKVLGERFFKNYQKVVTFNLPFEDKKMLANNEVYAGIIDIFPDNNTQLTRVQVYFQQPSLIDFDYNKYVFSNESIRIRKKISKGEILTNLKIADEKEYLNNGYYFLKGNYGILYEYLLEFSEVGKYEIFFTANGGPASCVIMLGEQIISDYSNQDKKIGEFEVNRPGIKRLLTFPLPGSNYPTTVTIVKERVYTN